MNRELFGKLICIICGSSILHEESDRLICAACGQIFLIKENIPDFLSACRLGRKIEWKEEDSDPAEYEGIGRFISPSAEARSKGLDRPLLRYIKGDVLEIGCATCRLASEVEARGGRYFGLDPLSSFLAFARKERGLETIVKGRGERLPFKDNSFDSVIAGFFSYVYVNPQLGLPEVYRVLKRNGVFAFVINNDWIDRAMYLKLMILKNQWKQVPSLLQASWKANYFTFKSIGKLKKMAAASGLTLEKIMSMPLMPDTSWLMLEKCVGSLYYKNFLITLGHPVFVFLKSTK